MFHKPLIWIGSALDDLRQFPTDVRQVAGHQLRRLQSGLLPDGWKPMRVLGDGACEIRIRTDLAHRIIYVAKFDEGIYVLHVFQKRSRRTRSMDIELARVRYREMIRRRR